MGDAGMDIRSSSIRQIELDPLPCFELPAQDSVAKDREAFAARVSHLAGTLVFRVNRALIETVEGDRKKLIISLFDKALNLTPGDFTVGQAELSVRTSRSERSVITRLARRGLRTARDVHEYWSLNSSQRQLVMWGQTLKRIATMCNEQCRRRHQRTSVTFTCSSTSSSLRFRLTASPGRKLFTAAHRQESVPFPIDISLIAGYEDQAVL